MVVVEVRPDIFKALVAIRSRALQPAVLILSAYPEEFYFLKLRANAGASA